MSEYAESVKRVSDYMLDLSSRNKQAGKDDAASRLAGYSDELNMAYDHILILEGLTSALPPDLGNIHDLPQELLSELSIAKTDELEDQLVTVINSYGDQASLDQILVGLFRKYKISQKRRFVQNKLYRMSMVWSVGGRKGLYTTAKPEIEPEESEFERIAEEDISDEIDFGDTEDVPF